VKNLNYDYFTFKNKNFASALGFCYFCLPVLFEFLYR